MVIDMQFSLEMLPAVVRTRLRAKYRKSMDNRTKRSRHHSPMRLESKYWDFVIDHEPNDDTLPANSPKIGASISLWLGIRTEEARALRRNQAFRLIIPKSAFARPVMS